MAFVKDVFTSSASAKKPEGAPEEEKHNLLDVLAHQWPVIAGLGVFFLLLLHAPPFRRAVLAFLALFWRGARGVFWDAPAAVWNAPAVRAVRLSRTTRFLYRHFFSPLLFTLLLAGVFFILGVPARWLVWWGLAVFGFLTAAYNTSYGWALMDRLAEALSDWWRLVRVNLIPGLIGTVIEAFRALGNWVERQLYAVDEWMRFRRGDSGGSVAAKAVLGLMWFPVAYLTRFAFYLLVEPQVNPVKQLKENWRLYRANRPPELTPVVLGSHGESMRRLLRPGFHSGTVPKLHRQSRHALDKGDRAKAARLHHELEHAGEGVHRFVARELLPLLAGSPEWGGVAVAVGAVRFGCQRAEVELLAPALGRDPLVLGFENVGGSIEAGVAREGWADKLTAGQRDTLTFALRGLLDMGAAARYGDLPRAAEPPPGPGFGALAARVTWPEWVARWGQPAAPRAG